MDEFFKRLFERLDSGAADAWLVVVLFIILVLVFFRDLTRR